MNCRQLVELVTDYMEGALGRDERARFDQHLTACPWCDRYLTQMRRTARALRELDERGLSPEARERFIAAFRDWHAGERPLREPPG